MSKFKDMFNKSIRAEIEFIDLDNGEAKLDKIEIKGKQNAPIDYDPSDKIEEFTNEGYELASNDLNIKGVKPSYDDDGHIYYVGFHHGTTVVDADHPAYGYSSDQLAMKVTQTVHYEGASTRTPIDSKIEMDVHKRLVVDRVNGEIIKDSHWQGKFSNFKLIATPIVPGFVADQAVAGGKAINVFHPNKTYTVKYQLNKKPVFDQTVKIEYVDILDNNKIIATDEIKGKANMPIDYDPAAKLAELSDQGFDLVDNGFNGDDNVQFFGDSEQVPVFVITMKHNYALVNEKHPLDGIDKKEYYKEVSFIVNFTGAGDKTPKPKKQTAILTRSLFVVPKNKKIVGTSEWKSNLKKFDDVTVPELNGYNASANVVKALPIGKEDQVVTVNYVNETKSVHATRVADSSNTPHTQIAIISFIDIDNNGALITSSGALTGQPGESINDLYSTEVPLRVLKQSGYKVVFDNFDAPGVIQRFDNNDLLPQVFTIGLKKVAQEEPSLKIVDNQQQ